MAAIPLQVTYLSGKTSQARREKEDERSSYLASTLEGKF
jgi:hypothetical protein